MSKNHKNYYSSDESMEEVPDQFQQGTHAIISDCLTKKIKNAQHFVTPEKQDINRCRKYSEEHYRLKTEKVLTDKNNKINHLREQEEKRILADCTFKPSINKSTSKSSRDLNKFLENQQRHLQKIKQKKQGLKRNIQAKDMKNMTFSPSINRKKKGGNKQNVHERLYKLKDKDKSQWSSFHEQNRHIPKINQRGSNMVRNIPIDELLYRDAQRRAQKIFEVPEKQNTLSHKNYLQEKYVAQRLLKDFKLALQETQLNQKSQFSEEELFRLLKQMGYAQSFEENSKNGWKERKLLQDSFSYLQSVGVNQINLYVFLLALGGIYNVDLNNQELTSVLFIDDFEGKKLHSYFDLLFRNKLIKNPSKKSMKSVENKITICKQFKKGEEKMVQRYRQKMIEKANNIFEDFDIGIKVPDNGISHQDLLVIHNLGKNLQKQKIRQQKKLQKDPECTFQPNAQKYENEIVSSRLMEDKCQELYNGALQKQKQRSKSPTFKQVSKNEQLSEKRSNISPRGNSQSRSRIKSYLDVKDVDKVLSRMEIGRSQRNQKKLLIERGQKPLKKKIIKKKKQLEEEQAGQGIILQADIVINSEKKKILIKKGDENRIKAIVDKFAQQNDIDDINKELLFNQLCSALQNLKYESYE